MALSVQQDMFASINLINCNYVLGMGDCGEQKYVSKGVPKDLVQLGYHGKGHNPKGHTLILSPFLN